MSLLLYFIRIPLAAQKPCSFFHTCKLYSNKHSSSTSVSCLLLQDNRFPCELWFVLLHDINTIPTCICVYYPSQQGYLDLSTPPWALRQTQVHVISTKHAGAFTARYSLRSVPFKQASCLCYYFIVWWSCPEHVLALDMLTWVTYPSGSLASRTQTRNTEAFFFLSSSS